MYYTLIKDMVKVNEKFEIILADIHPLNVMTNLDFSELKFIDFGKSGWIGDKSFGCNSYYKPEYRHEFTNYKIYFDEYAITKTLFSFEYFLINFNSTEYNEM